MVKLNYKVDHIPINEHSRPGDKLLRVQAGVIHWTADPGATDENEQNYFSHIDDRYASAHIFVDRDSATELIPLDEVAYHANERKAGPLIASLKATAPYYIGGNANLLTIGVEMCVEADRTIHPDTIARTVLVMKMLQAKFPQLKDTKNRFVRHYDVTGKNCPAPMVSDPKKWEALLDAVDQIVVQTAVTTKQEVDDDMANLFNPSNSSIKNSVNVVLARLEQKDPGAISDVWQEKLKEGTLTDSDALGILFVAIDRGLIVGNK